MELLRTQVGGACHPLTSMCGEAIVIIKSDMQNTTGTLSPGAHAGSYNGHDAYNDMLITDGSKSNRKRTTLPNDDGNNIERSGLYARSTGNSNRGGMKKI